MISQVAELRMLLKNARQANQTVGLVPTMGYLHEGHLTLMRQAKREQDVVVASIFVNPLQFGPNEDYAVYPRNLERDGELAAGAGVDILFTPRVEDMYPQGYENMLSFVEVTGITKKLCGASRPGHFRGVTTVVAKLFNIARPDAAYFGQKDAQQVAVIKRMVADLNMDIRIVAVPIVREADGLALSSRNVFLNPAERQAALVLHRSLELAGDLLAAGQRDAAGIKAAMAGLINKEPLAAIEYISLCDLKFLEELAEIESAALIAIAVKIGKTRLIDNRIWRG
ncbi:MAG: pantoate--beta-alanine ligase [Veillonellales bacterium]